MKPRTATVARKTNETDITVSVTLDGSGAADLTIPVGFLAHMLTVFAKQALIDVSVNASGDLYIDEHHTVEDIGIVLGRAFREALGDKRGIERYGCFILPMDEAVATVAIDFSGRSTCSLVCPFTREKIGDMATELVYEFWNAFAAQSGATIAIKVENGMNDHHKAEALFKAMGRAVRAAVSYNPRNPTDIPSTKGVL